MPSNAGESLTLYYFGGFKGLAEQPRLLAELGGLKYDFKPVEDWAKEKPHTPYGQVPVLIVKDASGKEEHLAQSTAICRFLAKRGGLYPADDDAVGQAVVDGVVEASTELRMRLNEYMRAPDDDGREAAKRRLCAELVPPYVAALTRQLERRGNSGYFWRDGHLTVAEVAAYVTAEFLRHALGAAHLVDERAAPALARVARNVEQHPNARAYLASDRAPRDWVPGKEWVAKFKEAIDAANKARA